VADAHAQTHQHRADVDPFLHASDVAIDEQCLWPLLESVFERAVRSESKLSKLLPRKPRDEVG